MKLLQKSVHFFAVFASALVLSTVGLEGLGGIAGISGVGSQTVLADKGGGDDSKGADDNQTSGNDGQDDTYSFYHLASSAGTYFDASQNPDTKVKFMDSGVKLGNAGGLLGYEDSKYDTHHWIGALTSAVASSSQGHSYQTYEGSQNEGVKRLYYYTLYGHSLESMGLDSTDSQSSFGATWRKIGGALMMVAYAAAISVPLLFTGIAKLMQFLNPFQLFINSIQQTSGGHEESVVDKSNVATKSTSGPVGQAVGRAMANARGYIGGLYIASQQIGLYAVLPITLVLGILMWVLFNLNLGSILKKTFIRLAVIVVGIPIFADLYTHTLDEFVKVSSTDPDANIVLASTFDDFEAWARKTRLAMPSGTKITISTKDHPSGDVIDNSTGHGGNTTDVRNMALRINSIASNGLISGLNSASTANVGYSDRFPWREGNLWTDNSSMTASGQQTTAQMGAGFSVLGRYLNNAYYTAANYETMYKSHIPDAKRGQYMKGIKYLATNTNAFYQDGKAYFAGNDSQAKEGGTNVSFLHNAHDGGLEYSASGDTVTFTGNGQSNNSDYGLSSLALYNYLTTDFTDGGVNVYSPSKVSSSFVSKYHHSVNLIGTSATRYAYAINAFVLFCAIAAIGWGYALATLWTTLAREVKILVHVMPAMMGSLRGGAKLLTSILVIIAQILVTEFMYQLAMDLLMSLNLGTSSVFNNESAGGDILAHGAFIQVNTHITSFIQSLASGRMLTGIPGVNVNSIKADELGTFIYLIASTIITAGFAMIALKTRSSFVDAISTTLSDIIDKLFLNGNSNPLSQASPGQGGASSDNDNGQNLGQQALNEGMSIANYANIASMRKNNSNGTVNNHAGKPGAKSLAKGDKAGAGKNGKGTKGHGTKANGNGAIKNSSKQSIGGSHSSNHANANSNHGAQHSVANNNNAQSNAENNANSMNGNNVMDDGISNGELNGSTTDAQNGQNLNGTTNAPVDDLTGAQNSSADSSKGLEGSANTDAQSMSDDELNAGNAQDDAIKGVGAQSAAVDDLGDPNAQGQNAQDDLSQASAENGSQDLATDSDQPDAQTGDLNAEDAQGQDASDASTVTNGSGLATENGAPAGDEAGDVNAQDVDNTSAQDAGDVSGQGVSDTDAQANGSLATDDSAASSADDASLNAQDGAVDAYGNPVSAGDTSAQDASASNGLSDAVSDNQNADVGDPNAIPASDTSAQGATNGLSDAVSDNQNADMGDPNAIPASDTSAQGATNGLSSAVSDNQGADMGDPNAAPASAGTPSLQASGNSNVLPKNGIATSSAPDTVGSVNGADSSIDAPAGANDSAGVGSPASANAFAGADSPASANSPADVASAGTDASGVASAHGVQVAADQGGAVPADDINGASAGQTGSIPSVGSAPAVGDAPAVGGVGSVNGAGSVNDAGSSNGADSVNGAYAGSEHGVQVAADQGSSMPTGDINGSANGNVVATPAAAPSSADPAVAPSSADPAVAPSPTGPAIAPAGPMGSSEGAAAEHGVAIGASQNPPQGSNGPSVSAKSVTSQPTPEPSNVDRLKSAGVNLAKASVPVMGHTIKNVASAGVRTVYGLGKMAETGSDQGNFSRAGTLMHQTIHPYSAPARGKTLRYNARTNEFTGRANYATGAMASSYNHTQEASRQIHAVNSNLKKRAMNKARSFLDK